MAVVVLFVALGAGLGGYLRFHDRSTPTASDAGRATSPSGQPTATQSTSTTSTTSTLTTSAAAASFADLYSSVSSGVVRISATTCDGGGIGTGFLIEPTLVATAGHVVDGAAALGLTVGEDGKGGFASGIVVGIDHASDIALVRTDRALSGHIFELSTHSPSVGQEVAAIGFPVDEPMTLTRGSVSGLNRTISIDGVNRTGLIQTDTAINPGNSGGPMLAQDGKVYGVVDAKLTGAEGIAYAVSPEVAQSRLSEWENDTESVVSAGCDAPQAPAPARDPDTEGPDRGDAQTDSVVAFYDGYFGAINTAEYDAVWQMLSPRLRGESSAGLAKGLATTFDTDVQVHSVTQKANGRVLVHVSFTSFQAAENGPNGDMCDNWNLDHLLVPVRDSWQIYAVSGHQNGKTHRKC